MDTCIDIEKWTRGAYHDVVRVIESRIVVDVDRALASRTDDGRSVISGQGKSISVVEAAGIDCVCEGRGHTVPDLIGRNLNLSTYQRGPVDRSATCGVHHDIDCYPATVHPRAFSGCLERNHCYRRHDD